MLFAISNFNYNVNYVKRKKHIFILRGVMCDSHYVLGKKG